MNDPNAALLDPPDLNINLLPSAAYLRSLKAQNIPTRRVAIADAHEAFESLGPDAETLKRHLALLGLIGETMQVIEDVAALATSFIRSAPGIGFYVLAASPSQREVTNFYNRMHKATDDDILELLLFRAREPSEPQPRRLQEVFDWKPPLADDELRALEEAELATAKLVKENLVRLADVWNSYGRYFLAFKHALVIANPVDVEMLDANGEPDEQIIVWRTKNVEPIGVGGLRPPYEDHADYLHGAGLLAVDMLDQLVESRLWFVDAFTVTSTDPLEVKLKPMSRSPWAWWFHAADVSDESRQVLSRRLAEFEMED